MVTSNVVSFPSGSPRRLVPSRLRDARRAKRFNQAELGRRIGVTRQAISAYERGDKAPDGDTFVKIVQVLEQPPTYFTSDARPAFGEASPRFFRKFGADTNRRNDACGVLGDWFVQTAYYFNQFVNYPAVRVPQATLPSDPSGFYEPDEIEQAADNCRKQWGLGFGPISNVLALLESNGITVCRYSLENEKIEAFSFWNGDRPFIFIASEKDSSVRSRFDLAHELGHLSLHRWLEESELEDPKILKIREAEADRFASAFLLPHKTFPNEVYTTRLDGFVSLKRRWLASVQAMIIRSRDLGLIDADQTLNLFKQVSFRKWRTKEPLDDPKIIQLEQPRLLRRAVQLVLDGKRKQPEEIIGDLALNASLLEAFCNLPPHTLTTEGTTVEPYEPTLK